jgi:hypothetical protein
MFEGWDSYFLLIGGAAGALIGLLFVVASLPSGIERETRMRGASLFMTPIVFHFAVVVVVSGIALAPKVSASHAAWLLAAAAAVGAAHLAYVVKGIASPAPPAAPHWSDLWCYGVAPFLIYLCLGGSAWAVGNQASWAPDAVAAAGLLLLLIGIRNAWDLVTWLAPGANNAAATGNAEGEGGG